MDPIYESYYMAVESAKENLTTLHTVNKSFKKMTAEIAKTNDLKDKGVRFEKGNLKNLNLKSKGIELLKSIGRDGFGVNIIEDAETSKIQVIAAIGPGKHNTTQAFMKAVSFKDAEEKIRKWAKSIELMPASVDVNKAVSRSKSGRL